MTITSKPQDHDPLIRRQRDQLGNEEFVGTELLLRFFDDLAQISNTETTVIREIVTSANQQQAKNSAQAVTLSRELAEKLSAVEQQLSRLLVAAQAIQQKQAEIESKTNSLEHLCLSNLVR